MYKFRAAYAEVVSVGFVNQDLSSSSKACAVIKNLVNLSAQFLFFSG